MEVAGIVATSLGVAVAIIGPEEALVGMPQPVERCKVRLDR